MTIDVLVVGGTGESFPGDTRTEVTGLLKNITDQLDPTRFRPIWVNYPASYGHPMSYAASKAVGKANLTRAIEDTPNPAILIGYSQGACIVGDLAAELHKHPHLDVRGVGLVADPERHEGQYFGPRPGGYGVAGSRFVDNTDRPVWSVAAMGDTISALPVGNPIRMIADLTAFMDFTDPTEWGRQLLERAKAGQWQHWWDWRNWRTWAGAIAYARGYLIDGRHTTAYINDGHLDRLAAAINATEA